MYMCPAVEHVQPTLKGVEMLITCRERKTCNARTHTHTRTNTHTHTHSHENTHTHDCCSTLFTNQAVALKSDHVTAHHFNWYYSFLLDMFLSFNPKWNTPQVDYI